jgi:hypothetical protein
MYIYYGCTLQQGSVVVLFIFFLSISILYFFPLIISKKSQSSLPARTFFHLIINSFVEHNANMLSSASTNTTRSAFSESILILSQHCTSNEAQI